MLVMSDNQNSDREADIVTDKASSMEKKVIVAGHICLDVTPVFQGRAVRSVSDILKPGRLVQMGDVDVHTGGCVANTGLGMKLLGADVSLMGKIGSDEFGDMIYNILDKYNAADGLIRADDESTSYSVVLAIPGIDRMFLHNSGANNSFCADDVDEEKLREAAHFHFGYPPLMAAMFRNNGEQLLELFRKAKAAGCTTSLDMAAVDEDTEAGRACWDTILMRVLPYVDYFLPSAEELCYMLDRECYEKWDNSDIANEIKPLADKCIEYGAGVVVVKCGAPGMYYRTAEKEGFERSYKPDKVLSGTGAGDTSIAAFLTAMLEGSSIEECIQLAAAEGASCVAAYDALSGIKPLEELRRRIGAGWEKV